MRQGRWFWGFAVTAAVLGLAAGFAPLPFWAGAAAAVVAWVAAGAAAALLFWGNSKGG